MFLEEFIGSSEQLEKMYQDGAQFAHSFESFILHLMDTEFWRKMDYPQNPFKATLPKLCHKIDELNNQLDHEPAYHDRRHFVDVCLSLTLLLYCETKFQEDFTNKVHWMLSKEQKWMLLMCAVGHDYGHRGRINLVPFEIEGQSFEYLKDFILELPQDIQVSMLHGMEFDQFLGQIQTIIISTDPQFLPTLVKKIEKLQNSFIDKVDVMSMLLVEADLMASITPIYGKELSKRLSQEWSLSNPDKSEFVRSDKGRLGFLNYVKFMSHNSKELGVPEILQKSINLLKH
jgi:hypothetical protein